MLLIVRIRAIHPESSIELMPKGRATGQVFGNERRVPVRAEARDRKIWRLA
jgi:hypothetical protein